MYLKLALDKHTNTAKMFPITWKSVLCESLISAVSFPLQMVAPCYLPWATPPSNNNNLFLRGHRAHFEGHSDQQLLFNTGDDDNKVFFHNVLTKAQAIARCALRYWVWNSLIQINISNPEVANIHASLSRCFSFTSTSHRFLMAGAFRALARWDASASTVHGGIDLLVNSSTWEDVKSFVCEFRLSDIPATSLPRHQSACCGPLQRARTVRRSHCLCVERSLCPSARCALARFRHHPLSNVNTILMDIKCKQPPG